MVWPGERTHINKQTNKKYKITPCASATAIGGTICSDIVGYSASKGIGGVAGGNFIFSYRISRNPIRKELY